MFRNTVCLGLFVVLGLSSAACAPSGTVDERPDVDEGEAVVSAFATENQTFAAVADLVAATPLVVSGRVQSVEVARTDPNELEGLALTVYRVDVILGDVLRGASPGPTISFEFLGPSVDLGTGEETPMILDGLQAPDVGDELVLFLQPASKRSVEATGVTHSLVSFDGILWVGADGKLATPLEGSGRAAHQLVGLTVDELASEIRTLTG